MARERKTAAITRATVIARALQALMATPVLAALFLLAVAGASALPDEPILKHLREDAPLFAAERPHDFTGHKIDFSTECLGMSFGLPGARGENALEEAVKSPVVSHCAPFQALLEESKGARRIDYFRYWHGYAAISRPILEIFSYHDLRMLTFNAMVLLFFALAFRLYRDFGAKFALAVLFPFFFVHYGGFLILWTKAAPWIVMLGASIYFASARRPYERDPFLAFFLIGALTSYVDLLSTPLLTFGLPAYVYFFYLARRGDMPAPRAQIERLAAIGCFWFAGYAGLWCAKFLLAFAVVGPHAIRDIVDTALFRIHGGYESVKWWPGAAIEENFEVFKGLWGAVILVVFGALPFAKAARRRGAAALLRRAPVLALLALSPFVWYEVLSNHSQIHGLFTHADLVLFFLPLSLILFGETDRFIPQLAAKPSDVSLH
ncbi:MAG: hypothetical protein GC153_03595 [Alphaproteobacteria bacterium]|nr:hypothetical protein [Alphaproteobacteria bacterium]